MTCNVPRVSATACFSWTRQSRNLLVVAVITFLALFLCQDAQAQFHAQTRSLIRRTWGISLSKSQVDTLFRGNYQGVSWQEVIEGVGAADEMVKALNANRFSGITDALAEAAKKGLIKQGIKRIGLAGGGPAVDVVFAVDKVRIAADRAGLANQMEMYFRAREGGLSKEQIGNKVGDMRNDHMNYSDDGWMIGTDSNPRPIRRNGKPSSMGPRQTWEVCEHMWNLKRDAGSYERDKQRIGEELRRAAGA
jgi:hypothetical protein